MSTDGIDLEIAQCISLPQFEAFSSSFELAEMQTVDTTAFSDLDGMPRHRHELTGVTKLSMWKARTRASNSTVPKVVCLPL